MVNFFMLIILLQPMVLLLLKIYCGDYDENVYYLNVIGFCYYGYFINTYYYDKPNVLYDVFKSL